jgi:hypothetical protein
MIGDQIRPADFFDKRWSGHVTPDGKKAATESRGLQKQQVWELF